MKRWNDISACVYSAQGIFRHIYINKSCCFFIVPDENNLRMTAPTHQPHQWLTDMDVLKKKCFYLIDNMQKKNEDFVHLLKLIMWQSIFTGHLNRCFFINTSYMHLIWVEIEFCCPIRGGITECNIGPVSPSNSTQISIKWNKMEYGLIWSNHTTDREGGRDGMLVVNRRLDANWVIFKDKVVYQFINVIYYF